MSSQLSSSAQKVQDQLEACGFSNQVIELQMTTRTSSDAARALGCGVEQIAKSLVFQTKHTRKPVLIIASGKNRVNEKRISELMGEPIVKASADYVRQHTGFSIGGVPPVGLKEKMDIFIDEDLLKYEEIWAAAGTSNSVFKLTPEDLIKMTVGHTISIK